MWSLGKVVATPEVLRVYIGSFWAQPLHFKDNEELFAMEQRDLMRDLTDLPRNRYNHMNIRAFSYPIH